jgi:hypothetical protein
MAYSVVDDVRDLADLPGWELSAVCFVRDYVEFHFDGPILRSVASPRCLIEGRIFSPPGGEWRDALCRLIGGTVQSVDDGDESITVDFGSGRIEIPRASREVGAEVAHFVTFVDGRMNAEPMRIWENLIPTRSDLSST